MLFPPAGSFVGFGNAVPTYSAPLGQVGEHQVEDHEHVPMEDDRISPDELTVVCSICEEHWPTSRLEEHSEMCAVLRQLHNSGLSVDGMLTTLANVIEEQVRRHNRHAFSCALYIHSSQWSLHKCVDVSRGRLGHCSVACKQTSDMTP